MLTLINKLEDALLKRETQIQTLTQKVTQMCYQESDNTDMVQEEMK